MDILHFANTRYTTKAFDPARKLGAEEIARIEELLRLSPSSTNAQPWHFFIAGTQEGRERIAKATAGAYAFNTGKLLDASHVVVFCSRTAVDETYLQTLLDQETHDGRFATPDARAGQHKGRSHFVNMHRFEQRDATHWADKQVYLALGTLLLGAAALGIDACPMEGFDQKILDEELGLRARGLVSTVIVSLGHRASTDFNASLPKSRLPAESVISRL